MPKNLTIEQKERYRDTNRTWYANLTEEQKEQRRQRRIAWRAANQDKVKASQKRWRDNNRHENLPKRRKQYAENPDRPRESVRIWHANNRPKWLANKHKRRAVKAGNGGSYTAQEWFDFCAKYGNRCLCCGRSDVKLTADHIVPLAKGGTSNIGNIQPLCQGCNSKKGTNIMNYREVFGR